ncbi:hypothetical protein Acr_17g0007660 [Actinidia rufa]|uniref:Uncharacterized protein n=1 Tax=Actinidia rufa TaxID=165716 RepID=A0A7J0G336_9ERIC|nr:hypothetical protein Acr_17g0007660 [Actinidia rufa]
MRKRPTCSERRGEGFGIKVIIKAPMKEQRDRAKALKVLCGVSVTASTRTVSTNQKTRMVRILGRCLFPKVIEKIHNDLLTHSSDDQDEDSQAGERSGVTLDVIGGSSSTGNAEASSEVPRGSTPSSAEGTITLEGAPLAINLVELIVDKRSTQPGLARIASLTELSEGCPPMPSDSLALENKEELSAEELDQLRVQLCSLTFTCPGCCRRLPPRIKRLERELRNTSEAALAN